MATTSEIKVIEAYIGLLGRAPDPAGLAYWAEQLDTAVAAGTDIDIALKKLTNDITLNDEWLVDGLGANDPTTEAGAEAIVTGMFQNLFGRAPSAADLEYYSGELADEVYSASELAVILIQGAQQGGPADAAVLGFKEEAATYYVESVSADQFSLDSSIAAIDGVEDAAGVTASKGASDQIAAQSFTLTTGTDNFIGSAQDDVFTGSISGLAAENTLGAADSIDGGDGDDLLEVSVNTAFTGLTTGSIADVERIELTNESGSTREFNAANITGAETIAVYANKSSTVNLVDLEAAVDLELHNQTSGTFSAEFILGAKETLATSVKDAATLTVNNAGTVANAAAKITEAAIAVTLDDIELLTVAALGDNVLDLAGASDVTALTVTGAGNLKINNVAAGVKTFDGSESTGNIEADLTSTKALTSASTGTGDDTLTVNEAGALNNATLAGGDGDDTLILNSDGGIVEYEMSGFESLVFGDVDGAELTLSLGETTGVTSISSTAVTKENINLLNGGSGAQVINSLGATENVTIASDGTGAATINYVASDGTVLAKGVEVPDADYALSTKAGLIVNVGAYVDNTGSAVTANSASSVTLNVASGKTALGAEQSVYSGAITASAAKSVTVDATGALAGGLITAGAATSVDVTSVAGGSLNIDAANALSLDVMSGKALDLSGGDLSGVQTAVATVDDGLLDLGNLGGINSLTVSGAGVTTTKTTASAVSVGALGEDTNDYDLSVTASGLKGGFTTSSIDTGDTYDIMIDVSGVTGDVAVAQAGTIGRANKVTVDAAGVGGDVILGVLDAVAMASVDASGVAGGVTINAIDTFNSASVDTTGVVGAVAIGGISLNALGTAGTITVTSSAADTTSIGAIDGQELATVNVDVRGSTGLVTLDTIAGKSVTVNAADAAGGVKTGVVANKYDITATTAANVAVATLQDGSVVEIDASANSTKLAVDVDGSFGIDAVTVTAAAKSTSITVTGDLGNGVDTLEVDGALAAVVAPAATGSLTIDVSKAVYDTGTLTGTALAGMTNKITGGVGNDTIVGGALADSLSGGGGADTITGAAGADTMTGGTGADIFVIGVADAVIDAAGVGRDVIKDMNEGSVSDIIRLAAANDVAADDVVAAPVAGVSASIEGGKVTFAADDDTLTEQIAVAILETGVNEVVFWENGTSTYVYISGAAGDGTNDQLIQLSGVVDFTTLTESGAVAGDFTLA